MISEIVELINQNMGESERFSEAETVGQLKIMSDENLNLWFQSEENSVLFF